ncbi:MAG: nuclease [Kiritimatiellaceae bacterium]|jgi:micrococcal nuclease|nr:nuclease [Kiritimatiellaceae bacterium]|tara:strand:- start:520 stop:903 length:384 start_codon:yes stop_codon:yes gene_type:complete
MAKMAQLHFYGVKEVVKIVDGDTVDLLIDLGFDLSIKIRVRMSGINAWESRTRNLKEKKLGLAAKDRLRELCEQAMEKKSLKILTTEKGKYGRYLGVLYGNGKNINDLLVSEGHAHHYDGGKRKKYG